MIKVHDIVSMKTILFIEDEPDLQKTLEKVLADEGFKVISALDGETGLNIARAQKPDLILLDLVLPKANGFEILEKIKQDQETKNIPIIVLTNLEAMDNIEKAIRLGATTYLVKANYSLKEVIEKVKKAIG